MQTSGALNASVSNLFQRLDTQRDGLSLEELQSLDQDGNGELSNDEHPELNSLAPEDIGFLNETLTQARTSGLKPADILFPDMAYRPQGEAVAQVPDAADAQTVSFPEPDTVSRLTPAEVLTQRNGNPYDFADPDVLNKALNLRLDGATPGASTMDPKAYWIDRNLDNGFKIDPTGPVRPINQLTLPLDTFYTGGTPRVTDAASLRKETLDYFRQEMQKASGGAPPSDQAVLNHIKKHGDLLMLQFGADGNANYTYSTTTGSSKLAGASTDFSGFQRPSTDTAYVCNDIHGAVAGFRKELMGQEAFVASSSGPDGAHLFTVYKDGENWNIQNYGTIVRTDAKSIQELYERFIPDNNVMRLYEVNSDGDLKLARNELTERGVENKLFRTQTGAQGLFSDEEFFETGTNGIRGAYKAFSGALDIENRTLALQISDKQQIDPQTTRHIGAVVQAKMDINEHGTQTISLDEKFEVEQVEVDNSRSDTETRTRAFGSGIISVKDEKSPLYTIGYGNRSSLWSIGANFSYQAQQLYGEDSLRGLAGFDALLGTEISLPINGTGHLYAGRSLYDTFAEFKTKVGVQYEQGEALQARAGLSFGPDLQNFYSFTDPFALLEANLFGEAKVKEGPMTLNALVTADLAHPGVFQISGHALYEPLPNLAFNTSFTYLNDPMLGNRGSLQLGGAWEPMPHWMTTGNVGFLNDGRLDGKLNLRYDF